MGSRLKEEEKNERAVRALLKQNENRRCINCGSMGPQYVCTTFSIFVCTTCSGLHREFSHRIKSVSMAKFTVAEVSALQIGGNERAREVFFKEWDSQRSSLPDSSNNEKLRDFIKNVYVERRYTGERPAPSSKGRSPPQGRSPPKGRMGDREDSYDARRPPEPRSEYRHDARSDRHSTDSRSPSYEDRYDDRRFERRRSDADQVRYDDRRNDDRNARFDDKRSPGRFETDRSRYDRGRYDDRRYDERGRYDDRDRDRRFEDRFANETRHDRRRSADDRPSSYSKDFDGDSPPVRPVSEILGDNVVLRVEDMSHSNGRAEDDQAGSVTESRKDFQMGRPSSFGRANGNVSAALVQRMNSGSLIDFSAESETSSSSAVADPFGVSNVKADFFGASTIKADPFGVSSIKADPFGLSSVKADQFVVPNAAASQLVGVLPNNTGWATFDTSPGVPTNTPPGSVTPPAGYPDMFTTSDGEQWSVDGWGAAPATSAHVAGDGWSSLVGQSVQPPAPPKAQAWSSFPTNSAPESIQHNVQLGLVTEPANASTGPQSAPGVNRTKELPKELFAQSFFAAPTNGLQFGPHVTGFPPAGPHFSAVGAIPIYQQPPRSRNPFDLPGDLSAPAPMGTFPSMGPLQAALPNLSTGPISMPGSSGPTFPNQWSMGLPPASFPPGGSAGSNGFSGQQSQNSGLTPSTLLARPVGPSTYAGRPFSADSMFPAQGSEFLSQSSARPLGGNPFG